MDAKKLGKLLREARLRKGLKQSEIARLAGYTSAQFISNIERGLCVTPLKLMSLMTKVYGIPKNTVIGIYTERERARVAKALQS